METLDPEIEAKITGYLIAHPGGSSSVEIAAGIQHSRITVVKYLEILRAHGLVGYVPVGKAHLWTVTNHRHTLLLVDDEPEILQMLSLMLRGKYELLTATSGQEALTLAGQADLVVLDLMMPGMSGEDVLREMKRQPALREKPLIVLSAKGDVDHKLSMLLGGADDYVTKPFDPLELEAMIDLRFCASDASLNPITHLPGKRLFVQQMSRPQGKDAAYLTVVSLKPEGRKTKVHLITLLRLLGNLFRTQFPGRAYHINTFTFCIISDRPLLRTLDALKTWPSYLDKGEFTFVEHTLGRMKEKTRVTLLEELL